MNTRLPSKICFRVTRNCNSHCLFCCAPPNGDSPDLITCTNRLDWLLSHEVKTINFCGGEPTLHPELHQIISYCHQCGVKVEITTNGIYLNDSLLTLLSRIRAKVKVSLFGDQEHHNFIAGNQTFNQTCATIDKLTHLRIPLAVQSTIITNKFEMVHWLCKFCSSKGVRQLNILPFIPRGNGKNVRLDFEMSAIERNYLKDLVKLKRRQYNNKLDIRWLDFNVKSIYVVEIDGRVLIERMDENLDTEIYRIDSKNNMCISSQV